MGIQDTKDRNPLVGDGSRRRVLLAKGHLLGRTSLTEVHLPLEVSLHNQSDGL